VGPSKPNEHATRLLVFKSMAAAMTLTLLVLAVTLGVLVRNEQLADREEARDIIQVAQAQEQARLDACIIMDETRTGIRQFIDTRAPEANDLALQYFPALDCAHYARTGEIRLAPRTIP
jgi:hypothetical protein